MKARSVFFEAIGPRNNQLVCYVVGFTAKVNQFKYSIKKLQKRGYDVMAFDYDNAVLLDGDPQKILDLMDHITEHIEEKADKYDSIICMGVSLGAFIAFNVQRRIPKALVGAYATAGIAVSEGIFWMKTFEPVRDALIKNGYNKEKLAEVWKEIEIREGDRLLNDKSFVIVNGTIDRVVDYKAATKQMKSWHDEGVKVKLFRKRGLGHTATILWYIFNTDKMLNRALHNHHNSKQKEEQK